MTGDGSATPIGATPQFVTMDGILEGRIGDGPAIAAAVGKLSRLGICTFEIDRDGGRFTVMPENRQVPGTAFDGDRQQELLDLLRSIATASRGPIESTLRCTMVFDQEVAETLFRGAVPAPDGPGIEALTRMRPRRTDDVPPELPPPPPWQQLVRRREIAIALPLLLIAFGTLAWTSGLLDRLLSANAKGMSVATGAFGDLLRAEVDNHWGNYRVTIERGAGYPLDAAAWDAHSAAAKDDAARQIGEAVRSGGEVFVQLQDDQDRVVAEMPTSLRPLVAGADGKVKVDLPGKMNATHVVISYTKYEKK